MINIQEEIKNAMKAKNTVKLAVLRQLKTELTNASVRKGDIGAELDEAEVISIIRKEVNKRKDSAKVFEDAGRLDLLKTEIIEQGILETYLPEELTDDKLEEIISSVLQEFDSPTRKDMGKIISMVLPIVAGRADNKKVSQLIASKL